MLKDILDAIRTREEEIEFLGKVYVVRELSASATLGGGSVPEGEDAETFAWWRMFVRSVFDKETGQQVFQDDDIAELMKGSRFKLAKLLQACNRVNGLDEVDNAKNSSAVQA